MENSKGDLRLVTTDEKIELGDIFLIEGRMVPVLPTMIGKSIQEASLAFFKGPDVLLSVFRQEIVVNICEESRVKVFVNHTPYR